MDPKPRYFWTREEETRLLELWRKGVTDPAVLAKELGRKPGAVEKKLERLSLSPQPKTTTSVTLSKELLTHEQALKVLAGALQSLRNPGQDKLELQRLRILVDAIQAYDSVLEKFERWSEIESRLLEMDKKIQELQKAQNIST